MGRIRGHCVAHAMCLLSSDGFWQFWEFNKFQSPGRSKTSKTFSAEKNAVASPYTWMLLFQFSLGQLQRLFVSLIKKCFFRIH